MIQPYRPRQPPKIPQEEEGDIPDYSQYKTNVAERLWRAKKEAKSLGATASPDIVPLAKEYQLWRKKMGLLNKYIDEYKTAMNVLSKKRSQVNNTNNNEQYSSVRLYTYFGAGFWKVILLN